MLGGLRSDFHWKASLFQTTLHSGNEVTSIDIRTNYEDIGFEKDGSNYAARCNFFVKIGSADRKIFGLFEDSMNIYATESDLTEAALNPSTYPVIFRRYFDLPPGKYEIYLAARDVKIGNRLSWGIHYTVPKS